MENRSRMTITIPQPFNLSSRSRKERKTSPAESDVDVELVKKFRARPIPAHTFLPLYEQMTELENRKRQANRDILKAQSLARQKPFSFCSKSHKVKSQSVPEGLNDSSSSCKVQWAPLKGSPRRPTSSLNLSADEAEILREIRIKTRAEFLFRTSALPPGLQKRQEERAKNKLARAEADLKLKQNSQFPVFRKRRTPRQPVSAPLAKSEKAVSESVKYDKEIRQKQQRPKIPENFSTPKMTYATMLRQKLNSERRLRESREASAVSNGNRFGLEHSVRCRVYGGKGRAELNEERLANFRESEKVRLQEYRSEIKAMMTRIKSKPLLIDRQSQFSAEQRMEKLFARKLCERGLDPEFVFAESRKEVEGGTRRESHSETTETEDQSKDEEQDQDDDDDEDTETDESVEQYQYTSEEGEDDDENDEIPERDVS